MNYLNFQYLQFARSLIIPASISTAIFSLAITQPAQAAQLTFSFDPDADNNDSSILE